jgi:ABC-type uncharacterized transport system ATPase subunit
MSSTICRCWSLGVLRRTLPYDNCQIGFVTSNTILTTHYLEEADALAHRIIVINKGRIVSEGTPSEIKSRGAGRKISCRTDLER